jgi:ABC-type glycerol-3-phosphate transport system substrate-binding protein
MAENPDIRVELVTLDKIPTNPLWLEKFDGAAFPPTANMIASGAVYDLTPLLESDLGFDQGDFYEQLWQGAWWRERMWFVPQAAKMRLLFYNKELYHQAGLAEPSLRWTWTEMGQDMRALAEVVTAVNSSLNYTVFLDIGRDSLFAYAYNWQTDCPEAITVRCQTNLTPERINAALAWRQQLTASALTPLSLQHRQARWNWQAAVRVEEPVYYEHFLQLSSMGVVPFPGSNRFDGITPLWLEGSFITQYSQNPLAVWRWLKFLSYQPPLPRYRLIPARPSVAQQTAYWQTLPRPLNEAMRSAFPFSKPVTIGDSLWFDDGMVTAVTTQELSPAQVAQQQPPIDWFTNN